MKSVLIIGLGRFGRFAALRLTELGNEVLAIDSREELVNDIAAYVTAAAIGDCTRESFMATLGISNFDLCICAIGDDFQASLEIVALLKEYGAQFILARAYSEVHEKFLLRMGADRVMFPEREMGRRVAAQYSMNGLADYIELSPEYSIVEMPVPPAWVGETVLGCNVRSRYNVNILAYRDAGGLHPVVDPSHAFRAGEMLMIMGHVRDLQKLNGKG